MTSADWNYECPATASHNARAKESSECDDAAELTSRLLDCTDTASQAAEELVEFVGGVEVCFEFAGGKALAKVVNAPR